MFANIFTLCIQTFDDEVEIQIDRYAVITPPKKHTINTVLIQTNPKIKEVYQDLELYQYFIDKSIEMKIDIIYNISFANCLIINESNWNPKAQNPISTAGGLFQFIDSTWLSTIKRMNKDWSLDDKYDAYKNIEAGLWLLSKDGYKHWEVWPSCIHLLPPEKRIKSL